MEWFSAPEYWFAREVLQCGIAAIYAIAFLGAARQFRPLIGEHGMLPIPEYLSRSSFRAAPSIFHLHYSDRFFAIVCWLGVAASLALVAGAADLVPLWLAMPAWLLIWFMYLSIVNVGQQWYGFGWESLLLEAGFLAIFLGNEQIAPPVLVIWLMRWLLFRVEFGAGLIKLRGDRCWRDLTCLYYHHETQPMPGPLSWFFHHLPKPLHRIEVAVNHFSQLLVPFALFAPQPVAGTAGLIVIVTQAWLVLSGNFAWLNWLTIVLAFSTVDHTSAALLLPLPDPPSTPATPTWFIGVVIAAAVSMLILSYAPVTNMVSRSQRMNVAFNALHLGNTYGAFGAIGRTRDELVIEGAAATDLSGEPEWKEYEFKGKPGDTRRLPRQWAPYHLRLDWLMWFAALSPAYAQRWLIRFLARLLENDERTLKLLHHNPFPDSAPQYVRVQLYRYRFTTWQELRRERSWWHRDLLGEFVPPITHEIAERGARRG
ncbi:lipase maturation factor family protein [Mycobacterium sp. B14F4]|uniref:lipase maturation factor family protein n=1 Tax=Mycobacterium sp. B14F4 TaxID=3153565 RepID=UPI00325E05D7